MNLWQADLILVFKNKNGLGRKKNVVIGKKAEIVKSVRRSNVPENE